MITPGLYRHFKGAEYIVVGVAEHSETGEKVVVYHEKKKENDLKIRPLGMFEETVMVEGKVVPRFEKRS